MKSEGLFKGKTLSKKIFAGLPVILFTVLASCGGDQPEADAQKMCDLMKKGEELKAAGKMNELLQVMDDAKKLGQELEARYKDDQEAQNLIEHKVKDCMGNE